MEERRASSSPPRLSLSHISQRHPSCRCGTVARSLARSLAAGFIILRGGGAMAGEEEEEDEVDYVDGVWAVGTPLRVGAMRQ